MQTAIATVCLAGTLNEKLEAMAAARFKGVEIFENDLLSFDGTPAQVGRRIKDLGLEAVTFQPFRDFEGMPEPQRTKAFSRAERKFDLMQELGCDLLMVCSNVSPDSLPGIERAADGIVNTTPLGMAKYPGMPLARELLRPDLWVADIVYLPLETELLATARALGCRTMDGGGMAVFQAADAFRLFSGLVPDPGRMIRHFESM